MDATLPIGSALDIAPGEIWAVGGRDAVAVAGWCSRLVRRDELENCAALVSFSQQAAAAREVGWMQARYYADDGEPVRDYLSYSSVWEVNPYEVGAKRPETRAAYRGRLARLTRLLALNRLLDRPLVALSNGEMRRVLIARALAKGPALLVLDDPTAGLDVSRRAKLKDVVSALARRGTAVVWAYRHTDELPDGVSKWLDITPAKDGFSLSAVPAPKALKAADASSIVPPPCPTRAASHRRQTSPIGRAVVEINHLSLEFGRRPLFEDFSWTVHSGERWILRGGNGSGKTTLFALITGDSPLAYASDVRVFGQRRSVGAELAKIRRRIGLVSPELQACTGLGPEALLDAAIARRPDLLLLDEPFLNLPRGAVRAAMRRIESFLASRPKATAILVSHRADESPKGFGRILDLDRSALRREVDDGAEHVA